LPLALDIVHLIDEYDHFANAILSNNLAFIKLNRYNVLFARTYRKSKACFLLALCKTAIFKPVVEELEFT